MRKKIFPSQLCIETNVYLLAILFPDFLMNLFSVLGIPESICGHFLLRLTSPTSCLSSLKPSRGSAPGVGARHKGGVVPRAAACHRVLIGRCCWAKMGAGRMNYGGAVCLSPDSSLQTKCGWLQRVPSPWRAARDRCSNDAVIFGAPLTLARRFEDLPKFHNSLLFPPFYEGQNKQLALWLPRWE